MDEDPSHASRANIRVLLKSVLFLGPKAPSPEPPEP